MIKNKKIIKYYEDIIIKEVAKVNAQYNSICVTCEKRCKQFAYVKLVECPFRVPKKINKKRGKKMPIPKVKPNEKQEDYIGRCLSAQKNENIPDDQKQAICFSKFRESKKSMLTKEVPRAIKVVKKTIRILKKNEIEEKLDNKIRVSEKTGVLEHIQKSLKSIVDSKRNEKVIK